MTPEIIDFLGQTAALLLYFGSAPVLVILIEWLVKKRGWRNW